MTRPNDNQTTSDQPLDGVNCSPSVANSDAEYPTPETDAMERHDAMCDPCRVVESDFARKLERQRDGAFALIDYAGEMLGIPKLEHKSAHAFKILQKIKELVSQEEMANSALTCMATALRDIDFLQGQAGRSQRRGAKLA